MATDVNNFTSSIVHLPFTRPEPPGIAPFGELVARLSTSVPAVGVGDTSVTILTTTLPRNYFYRLVELRIQTAATIETVMDLPEFAMACHYNENGVTVKDFAIWNQVHEMITSSSIAAYAGRNPSVTNDFLANWTMNAQDFKAINSDLIDASQGVSQFVVTWVNTQQSTGAMGFISYIRFLSYTIDQGVSAPVWTPQPTV